MPTGTPRTEPNAAAEPITIFVDLACGNFGRERPLIIQLAAIAVDRDLHEVDQFEALLRFNERFASRRLLTRRRYDRDRWQAEARDKRDVALAFRRFLRRHATHAVAHEGRVFQVARLAAHNGAEFDGPVLRTWYERMGLSLPASRRVLCTLQLAEWFVLISRQHSPPADVKLATLCQYFGIPLTDHHTALANVRATLELFRVLSRELRGQAADAAA